MAILEILKFPDKRLRHTAKPVETITEEIGQLVKDMLDTMYAANGVGLAAIQVGVKKRVIVLDISEIQNQPQIFINPEILEHAGREKFDEGCLSVPETWGTVERYAKIKMWALNEKGEEVTLEAEGLLADCIQHEIDHLNGKLYIDYISPLKLERIENNRE